MREVRPRAGRSINRLVQKPFLAGVARGSGYESAATGIVPGTSHSSTQGRARDAQAIDSYWRATGQHIRNAMETIDAELRSNK